MMPVKTLKPKDNCPFWSAKSLKCRLCKDGLFIPLEDHIEVYCKTEDYPQCLQYSLYADSRLQLGSKPDNMADNRRKYQRIETQHQVTLVKLSESGKIVTHHSTIAKTLDVSIGGMRLSIDTPFLNDTVVQFSFADSFPQSLQSGIGQVQWCNKHIDESGYQAGLSFRGRKLSEAMELYLNMHSKSD